ncbi:14251_t:CDS:2, partial [Funneliformis mosseae]
GESLSLVNVNNFIWNAEGYSDRVCIYVDICDDSNSSITNDVAN